MNIDKSCMFSCYILPLLPLMCIPFYFSLNENIIFAKAPAINITPNIPSIPILSTPIDIIIILCYISIRRGSFEPPLMGYRLNILSIMISIIPIISCVINSVQLITAFFFFFGLATFHFPHLLSCSYYSILLLVYQSILIKKPQKH